MNGRPEIPAEQHLLILLNHLMGHNVLDTENVPDGIGQRLAVVSLRTGKWHLVKRVFREGGHDLRNLFKQALSQFQEF